MTGNKILKLMKRQNCGPLSDETKQPAFRLYKG